MPIYELTSDRLVELPITSFATSGIRERHDLQRVLRDQIGLISPDTLVIAEEFADWSDSRRRIDLLGIDKQANLVVIELNVAQRRRRWHEDLGRRTKEVDVMITTLGQILAAPTAVPWDHALYLPHGVKWDAHTLCAVLDPDAVISEEDEAPPEAVRNRLKYALDMTTVRSIVENALEQRPTIGMPELLAAFHYYYDNDAFIRFGRELT